VPFRPGSNESNVVITAGRIKLVDPPEGQLTRGPDGLFRLDTARSPEASPNVTLVSGMLEGSNVNVVDALVDMISLSRQFETHMKLLQNAEGNAQRAGNLLSLS
jgi:flagellar basal-body rod protein FlgF